MKAIEILDKMLNEGWDTTSVMLTEKSIASHYNCATDFAQQYAGCGTVLLSNKTMKRGFNVNCRYALVWVKNDRMDYEDEFFHKAAFIGALDNDETIYFFEVN